MLSSKLYGGGMGGFGGGKGGMVKGWGNWVGGEETIHLKCHL